MGPLNARLEELRAAVTAAEQRVRALEVEHRQAGRETAQVEGELRGYLEEVEEAGEEPDPKRVAALRKKLAEVEQAVTVRPGARGVEIVNVETEGKLTGARRALEQRRQDLDQFLNANRPELAAERLPGSRALAERWIAAVRELAAVEHMIGDDVRACVHGLGIPLTEMQSPPRLTDVPGLAQRLADVEQLVRSDPSAVIPAPTWLVRS